MAMRRFAAVDGRSLLGLMGAGLALLAGCQAPAPGVPVQTVATTDAAMVTAFRKANGFSVNLQRPPAGLPMPGFKLAATDNLFGQEITIAAAAGDQEYVDVVYNSTAKQYLAVWHDFRNGTDGSNSDIYGQVIGPSGLPVGAALTLSNAAGLQIGPRVVFNSTAGEYFVAWTSSQSGNADVYCQRFTAAGAANGGAIAVASGTSNQTLAGLVYHPSQNQYLLTWTDDRLGYTTLEAARVSNLNVKVASSDVTISTTPGALGGGAIAINTGNEYLVTWADARTSAPGIYGQRLTSAGALTGGTITIAATPGFEYYAPRLAHNPVNNTFMAVYDRRNATTGEADAIGQRLTSAGAATGGPFALTAAAGTQMLPTVQANKTDGTFMVAWADGRAGATELDLYGKMYKIDGTEHLPEYVINAQTSLQAIPALTFDSTKKHFLVAFQDARVYATQGYNLYAQRVVSAPMTAEEYLDETLEYYLDAISTTSGGATGARQQLETAIARLQADRPENALTHLNNFLDSLPNLQSNGVITAEERATLEAITQQAIDQIEAGNF